jgi:hypothetical protein
MSANAVPQQSPIIIENINDICESHRASALLAGFTFLQDDGQFFLKTADSQTCKQSEATIREQGG